MRAEWDEDDEFDEDDPEAPDPSDMDSHDEPDLDACPYCRKLIYEDTEQCPHCKRYLSEEDAPLSKPAWIVIGTLLALAVMLLFYVM
jgi:hypothetical protein